LSGYNVHGVRKIRIRTTSGSVVELAVDQLR